jgi:hypothetical protein
MTSHNQYADYVDALLKESERKTRNNCFEKQNRVVARSSHKDRFH